MRLRSFLIGRSNKHRLFTLSFASILCVFLGACGGGGGGGGGEQEPPVVDDGNNGGGNGGGNNGGGNGGGTPQQPGVWDLVWSDEFDAATIDTTKWAFEENCWGGGNGEQQCYTAREDNAFIADGVLNIVAKRENYEGYNSPEGDGGGLVTLPYTSARLRTKNLADWTFGRFEIRAQLPFGQGTWPAIWMLPTNSPYGGWAAGGEIDIMEAVNLKVGGENRVHGTLHYGRAWPENVSSGTEYLLPNNESPADDFHTYAVEWEKGEVRWYVDDVHFATQREEGWYAQYQSGEQLVDAPLGAPFDAAQTFHLLLNLAVGGAWAGNVNAGGIDESVFPQTLAVDWVRVYECSVNSITGVGCATTGNEAELIAGLARPELPNSPYSVIEIADGLFFEVTSVEQPATLHYRINGGEQIDVEMTLDNGAYVYELTGLNNNDTVTHSFTYWDEVAGQLVTSVEILIVISTEGDVADSDADGVPDDVDQCSNTAAGSVVDLLGCPVDVQITQEEVSANTDNGLLVAGSDADNPGFTLYVFDNDQGSSGSVCNGTCATSWPPLLVDDGAASGFVDLGIITRDDGSQQATHEGKPLYYYENDTAIGDTNGDGIGGVWHTVSVEFNVTPLYSATTPQEPPIVVETDEALITRIADRGRDRHAKENHFSNYDHYLTFYWEQRTISIEMIDYVAKGGNSLVMNVRAESRLTAPENRWWYLGEGTLAQFCGNVGMTIVSTEADGHVNYTRSDNGNCRESRSIQMGDKLEIEISQFLDPEFLIRGRSNYYGTTFLYIVGEGFVPWDTYKTGVHQPDVRFVTLPGVGEVRQRDSKKIPEAAWLGGHTTIHAEESHEPDNHFMQMATNIGYDNPQPFVLGRRLVHTSFVDGHHDESAENGFFDEMSGLAGNHFINESCSDCHVRNGGAAPALVGEPLDKWVFKIGDVNGNPDPQYGRALQPRSTSGGTEGSVSLNQWSEVDGLRSPNYDFSGETPATFSARIAPRLVGMGLIDAIPEYSIMDMADPDDQDGDGISGRANLVIDPETGDTRLGRFGWKASQPSVRHQVAAALNTDMGVTTSLLPSPDCGSGQSDCGASGVELNDDHFVNLVKYVSLLGVRPQRDYDDSDVIAGRLRFDESGCADCHTPTIQTSPFHPFSELSDQTIHPYSDFLLHDMGPGLADNLGDGQASGAEWRTTPLWGVGLGACVTGGVTSDGTGVPPFGLDSDQYCTPAHSYLHDGRARTIEESILWHGGESQASKNAYVALPENQKEELLKFLRSL